MKPEVVSQLQGSTDSEHMAGLYISNLGDTEVAHSIEDMRNALLATIKTVLEVQKAVLKPEQLQNNGGASSLNLCACMLSRSEKKFAWLTYILRSGRPEIARHSL